MAEKPTHIPTAGMEATDLEASRSYDPEIHPPAHDGKRESVVPESVPDDLKQELEATHIDVYAPFPIDPDARPEGNILTVRALFVGCCLGALVNASNVYLGLKTGTTRSVARVSTAKLEPWGISIMA